MWDQVCNLFPAFLLHIFDSRVCIDCSSILEWIMGWLFDTFSVRTQNPQHLKRNILFFNELCFGTSENMVVMIPMICFATCFGTEFCRRTVTSLIPCWCPFGISFSICSSSIVASMLDHLRTQHASQHRTFGQHIST